MTLEQIFCLNVCEVHTLLVSMEKPETATRDIRVEKYKGTRYWPVWLGEELLAVTVYKKGAMAIKEILTSKKGSAYA